MRLKVMNPKGAPLSGLLVAIAERQKEYAEIAKVMKTICKEFSMDEEDTRSVLVNMCPSDLREKIIKKGDRYDTYHKARTEIVEAIAVSRRPKGGLKQMGLVENPQYDGVGQVSEEGQDQEYGDLDDEERQYIQSLYGAGPEFQAQILALVGNTKFKAAKGKGKGKKGSKGESSGSGDGKGAGDKGPQCYNCKELGHMQKDCPQPRRPRPVSLGGKADWKKGGGWPNQTHGNRSYPCPLQK